MTPSLPRSYLYVPGNAPVKLAGASGRGADALVVDLEDAVPPAGKDDARAGVLRWLRDGDPGGCQVWVASTPESCAAWTSPRSPERRT